VWNSTRNTVLGQTALQTASGAALAIGASLNLRARSGLTTEQLIYCGRAEGWLVVASLEPHKE